MAIQKSVQELQTEAAIIRRQKGLPAPEFTSPKAKPKPVEIPVTEPTKPSVPFDPGARQRQLKQQSKQADRLASGDLTAAPGIDAMGTGAQILSEMKPGLQAESTKTKLQAKILEPYIEAEKQLSIAESRIGNPDYIVDEESVRDSRASFEASKVVAETLTSKELQPFIEVVNGEIAVNVVRAISAGVDVSLIKQAGVSQIDIVKAKRFMKTAKFQKHVAKEAKVMRAEITEERQAQFEADLKKYNLEKAANNAITELTDKHSYTFTKYDDKGKPYEHTVKGTIDTVKAVKAGAADLVESIFGKQAVKEANEYIKSEIEYNQWLSRQPKNTIEAIRNAFTPWNEESGETLGKWVINIPGLLFQKRSQEELKEQHEAEQSQPLWARIIFGGDTVYKDKKGNYFEVIAGEAPPIIPAGGSFKLSTKATKDIISALNKSGLKEWEQVAINYMRRGNIRDVPSSVQVLRTQAPAVNIVQDIKYTQYVPRTGAQVFSQNVREFKEWERLYLASQKYIKPALRGTPQSIKVFGLPMPTTLTKTNLKAISEQAVKVKPSIAIKELTETKLLPAMAVAHPEVLAQIMANVSPELASSTLTNLSALVKIAVQQQALTETQAEAVNEVIENVQSLAKTQVMLTNKYSIPTKLHNVREATTSKPPDATSPKIIPPVKPPVTESPPTKRRLPPPPKDATDEEKREYIKKQRGATAWLQGELKGGKVWHVVTEPYSEATHLIVVGDAPEGAKLHSGVREAYKSITQLSGKPPDRPITLEGGAVDPVIFTKPDKTIGIAFTKDKKYRRSTRKGKATVTQSSLAPDLIEIVKGGKRRRRVRR